MFCVGVWDLDLRFEALGWCWCELRLSAGMAGREVTVVSDSGDTELGGEPETPKLRALEETGSHTDFKCVRAIGGVE